MKKSDQRAIKKYIEVTMRDIQDEQRSSNLQIQTIQELYQGDTELNDQQDHSAFVDKYSSPKGKQLKEGKLSDYWVTQL